MRKFNITENSLDKFYVYENNEDIYISHISFGKIIEKVFLIGFDQFGIELAIYKKKRK